MLPPDAVSVTLVTVQDKGPLLLSVAGGGLLTVSAALVELVVQEPVDDVTCTE